MNKQEVNKLLALMKANYSYAFKTMSQQDKYLLLNTWTFTLQDLNADVVMIAVLQLISESKWLPTVAEIREQCKKLHYSAAYGDCEGNMYRLLESVGHEFSEEEKQARNRKKAALDYIASATNHLRGDGNTAGLSLDSIMSSGAFASLGSGETPLSMLGEARYELTDGSEEDYP